MESEYSGGDILAALERADHYNDYLTRLVRRAAGPEKELVDFGAGLGTFSKRFRAEGYQVICVEPDTAQRARLEAMGFETVESVEALEDSSTSFVFTLNVLEHIEDDAEVVKQLHRKLKPGGTLLIYLPAFNCLWSSLDNQVKHFRRYTKRTLRLLVEQAGFRVEELAYADSLGFAAASAFRLLGKPAEAISPSSVAFYDRWVFQPSRVFDLVLHPVFGKNVYTICRK